MTEIKATCFRETGGEMVYTLRSVGHAEGFPEACAGISAILWSLAGWMENTPERANGLIAAYRLESGAAECLMLAETPSAGAASRAVWDLTLIGLMQLEKKYPQALRIEIRGGEPG